MTTATPFYTMDILEAVLARYGEDGFETDQAFGFHAYQAGMFVRRDEMHAFSKLVDRMLQGRKDDTPFAADFSVFTIEPDARACFAGHYTRMIWLV
jgi:hypothetical protein